MKGNEEEYWTRGRGESVIDYVLMEEEAREEVESLEIKDYIDSDHHLLVIRLKGGRGRKRNREDKGERMCERGIWDEVGREQFRRELERVE